MDLVQAIQKFLKEVRDAAMDGRISLREAIEIAAALGEVLRIIGQIIPGAAIKVQAEEA